MFSVSRFVTISAAVALSATAAFAQSVISAKSGLVHYVEGDVAVNGEPVADKAGTFTEVKKDNELNTNLGRAEVLLTPGVFLRVGEKSAVKMLNTSLADTRVQVLSGASMVESDTPMKDNQVTILYKDYATTFLKHGLYEFQTEPAQLKVYSGEAQVTVGGQTVNVREGRSLIFTAALAQEHFDPKLGDSLYRWSKVRSEYISVANVSAARTAQSMGYGNSFSPTGGIGSTFGQGNWFYNNYYGMYTYLPMGGTYYSPFGFAYYSPTTVNQFYNQYAYGAGSGYGYGSSSARATSSSFNRLNHSGVTPSGMHSSVGGVSTHSSGVGFAGSAGRSSVTAVSAPVAVAGPASGGRGK